MNKETGQTFLMREFESLLAKYGRACWTRAQIQIVRDWIAESGCGFYPAYDRLEAADLCGRPFTGRNTSRTGRFAQEVLLKLVTLRDAPLRDTRRTRNGNDPFMLRMSLRLCLEYATHLPTCFNPNGCDCGFFEMYRTTYDLAQEPKT